MEEFKKMSVEGAAGERRSLVVWLGLLLLFHFFFADSLYRYWFFHDWFAPGPRGANAYLPAASGAWVAASGVQLLAVAAALRIFRLSLPETGWRLPIAPARQAALGFLAGIGALIFNLTVLNTLLWRVQQGAWKLVPFSVNDARVGIHGEYSLFAAMLAWTIGPVLEELVYRGVIYTAVEKRWKGYAAVFVSALLFALIHFSFFSEGFWRAEFECNLNIFLKHFVTALVFGWLRMRTGSLLAPVAAHSAHNIGISVLAGTL